MIRRRRAAAVIATSFCIYALYAIFYRSGQQASKAPEAAKRSSHAARSLPSDAQPTKQAERRKQPCSMETCFDWTRCSVEQPKIHVHPTVEDSTHPPSIYSNILEVLRNSPFHTDSPAEACLLFLSIDTLDRDTRSENFVKNMNSRIALLGAAWNNGSNYLVFNLYSGTYPNYSGIDLGFNMGKAMLARASSDQQNFRPGFDVSFPLFHKEHPLRSPIRQLKTPSASNKYFTSFKGKRYVYGIGSETRDLLHHIHNNRSIIIATTCRHNTDWKKYEDGRCSMDNQDYDRWDYADLMENSTFCLVPRGRRLGSFRFLEALRAGCIPVVLSDGWVLPFSEAIDWSKAAIVVPERMALFVLDRLAALDDKEIVKMKRQIQLIFHRYFSSVEKIVQTTIEVVFERFQAVRSNLPLRKWNSQTEILDFVPPLPTATFTVVFQGTSRPSTRLNRLVTEISSWLQDQGLKKVVVMWPRTRDQPPMFASLAIPLQIHEVDNVDQSAFLSVTDIEGDFALFIDERVHPKKEEVLGALEMAKRNPSRLITFHALHFKQGRNSNWMLTFPTAESPDHSIALLYYTIVHRHFLEKYQKQFASIHGLALQYGGWFTPQCHFLHFNFMFSDLTLSPPMWLAGIPSKDSPMIEWQRVEAWMLNANYSTCFNRMLNLMYNGEPPLLISTIRQQLPYLP